MKSDLTFGPWFVYPTKAAVSWGRSLVWSAHRRQRDAPGDLRILFYHRVADDDDPLAVRVERFAQQMEIVARRGIRLLDLESAVSVWEAGSGDEGVVVALTFDDGYADMLSAAAPILEAHGFTATLFVPTGPIDGTARLTWYGDDQPALLTWDEIRRLAASGVMRIGAHTVTHRNLLALDDDAARYEIQGSRRILEERLGLSVETFSYPAGLYSEREIGYVREAGFRLAVTCDPGTSRVGDDVLALRRTQIERFDRARDFSARLGGAHDRPLPFQRGFRARRWGAVSPGPERTTG